VLECTFLSLARVTALVGAWLMYSAGAVSWADAERAPKTMLLLGQTDNDRTVDIRVGDSVRISLPENATTGFRWAIDRYDEEIIEAVATEPHYPANAIGSGGEVSFIFRGKKIGTGEIGLKNWRHWEGDPSVTARFRVRLHVQP
jgi:inhibitor of cysteine peptidase